MVQISTKEFRHESKMDDHTRWIKGTREAKANEEYKRTTEELLSLKRASLSEFSLAVKHLLSKVDYLLEFCRTHPYRRWRFTVFTNKQKTLAKMVKRMVPAGQKVCVGFGNWSQKNNGFLKGIKAPARSFKRALRQRATVVCIDECRTSKTCSACHSNVNLKHAHFIQLKRCKTRRCKTRRTISCSTNNEIPAGVCGKCKECVLNQKWRTKKQECYTVLHCTDCGKTWQRDVNAARNMHFLLMSKLHREPRPDPFISKNKQTVRGHRKAG